VLSQVFHGVVDILPLGRPRPMRGEAVFHCGHGVAAMCEFMIEIWELVGGAVFPTPSMNNEDTRQGTVIVVPIIAKVKGFVVVRGIGVSGHGHFLHRGCEPKVLPGKWSAEIADVGEIGRSVGKYFGQTPRQLPRNRMGADGGRKEQCGGDEGESRAERIPGGAGDRHESERERNQKKPMAELGDHEGDDEKREDRRLHQDERRHSAKYHGAEQPDREPDFHDPKWRARRRP